MPGRIIDEFAELTGRAAAHQLDRLIGLGARGGLPVLNAAFGRGSVAFDEAGAQLAADEAEWADKLICSVSDGAIITGQGSGGVTLVPMCICGDWLYYCKQNGANLDYIYRQQSGSTTITQTNDTLTNIGAIIPLSSGAILVTSGNLAYRSADGGQTLGDPVLTTTAGTVPGVFGGRPQAADTGTIILGEYASLPTLAAKLWRSTDDGLSFSVCYTATGDTDGGLNRHWHTTFKHAGRWLAFRGDGVNVGILASDDDGVTWFWLVGQGASAMSAIAMLDYGHPTRILTGSDSSGQVQWLDVLSASRRNLLNDLHQLEGKGYVFSLAKIDGVYYAPTTDLTGSNQQTTLRVSNDLEHWASYCRFPNTPGVTTGGYCVGYFDDGSSGKVYFRLGDTGGARRCFTISPPALALRQGIRLGQAVTNLLDDSSKSSFEVDTGGWECSTGVTLARSTAASWHGTASLKATYTSGGGHRVSSPTLAVSPGQRYRGVVRLRGTVKGQLWASLNVNPGGSYGEKAYAEISEDEWLELRIPEMTMPAGAETVKIYILGSVQIDDVLYVDGAQIERLDAGPLLPATWQLGGSPRADHKLQWKFFATEGWTLLATMIPEYDRICFETIGAGEYVYLLDLTNLSGDGQVHLYFDPGDNNKFNCFLDDGGDGETVSTANSHYFHRGGPIHVVIRCDSAGKVALSVANGRAVEHTGWTAATCLDLANPAHLLHLLTGSPGGAEHRLPGWLTNVRLMPRTLSDAEVETAMQEI